MTINYVVDAPIEAVFRYLADPSMTTVDIAPGYRVEPSGEFAPGAVRTLHGPGLKAPWQLEVAELIAPRKLTFRIFGADHPERVGTATYELQDLGNQTRVASTMQLHLTGRLESGARLLQPILWVQARRGNRKIAAAIASRYRAGELT